MINFNDILNEGVFNTTVDDVTSASVLSQIERLKEYNADLHAGWYHRSDIAKGYDVLGNQLKQGDWCLMPCSEGTGWAWRIALMVTMNGKLMPASVSPLTALNWNKRNPERVKVQYHRGIGTRDCIKIDDIDKFMKKLQ